MNYEVLFLNWKYPIKVTLAFEYVVKVEFLKFSDKFSELSFESNFNTEIAHRLYKDLKSYLSGKKVDFSEYKVKLPSKFVANVLEEVRKIPYGKTVTYGEIAKKIGTSPRAVGQALKRNPAPIIIPCHRVVGKKDVGGFSQGVDVKLELLRLEGLHF